MAYHYLQLRGPQICSLGRVALNNLEITCFSVKKIDTSLPATDRVEYKVYTMDKAAVPAYGGVYPYKLLRWVTRTAGI
jgi:hypothetical protein